MESENENNLKYLRKLIEQICTSGKPSLNEEKLKAVKKLCKQTDFYTIELYKITMKFLRKQHSEIRLSSFQLCNEIFIRSHCFRELILSNFTNFTDLTVGHNNKKPLPEPVAAAKKLKELAIGTIKEWYDKFKDGYHTLNLGYKFLRDCKNIDFDNLAILTQQDRQRIEESRRKQDEIRNRRVGNITKEMDEISDDISITLDQFKNGFKLLIPDLQDFYVPSSNDIVESVSSVDVPSVDVPSDDVPNDELVESPIVNEFGSDWMREHGINKETVIQVNLADIHKVQETVDNEIIIFTLRELVSNIENSLLPKVKKWEQTILQYSRSQAELVKKIVDIKNKLEKALKYFHSIEIIPQSTKRMGSEQLIGSDSDEDDDFIDVPFDDSKTSQEVITDEFLLGLNKNTLMNNSVINKQDLCEAGPSGLNKHCNTICNKNESGNKQNKFKFIDIEVESSKLEGFDDPFSYRKTMTGLNQIWAANEALHGDDEVKSSGMLGIATRPVNYEREWEPVKWECRHPLHTGRLCPRKDRERCPFHGPIVPRDATGVPLKYEDAKMDEIRKELYERKYPPWQDPSLLADIKANTGVDLDMKKVKERRRKYSNLTDLKKLQNTPRNRLAKKVLSKSSVGRINKGLKKAPR